MNRPASLGAKHCRKRMIEQLETVALESLSLQGAVATVFGRTLPRSATRAASLPCLEALRRRHVHESGDPLGDFRRAYRLRALSRIRRAEPND